MSPGGRSCSPDCGRVWLGHPAYWWMSHLVQWLRSLSHPSCRSRARRDSSQRRGTPPSQTRSARCLSAAPATGPSSGSSDRTAGPYPRCSSRSAGFSRAAVLLQLKGPHLPRSRYRFPGLDGLPAFTTYKNFSWLRYSGFKQKSSLSIGDKTYSGEGLIRL